MMFNRLFHITSRFNFSSKNSLLIATEVRNISNMNTPKVFITRPDIHQDGINLLKDECTVTMWNKPCQIPRDELLKNVVGKDAIYCTKCDKIDSELLDAAGPNLKVIGTISVGYDHIDVQECHKRGVRIGYIADVLTDATAELTIALLLVTSRRLFEANKEVYNGGWKSWSPMWMVGQGLKNSVVGIVGFENIGYEVARRALPFKPKKIIYFNESEKPEYESGTGAERVGSNDLLENSDFVICTIASVPETRNIFDDTAFAKMKQNSIFINTSGIDVLDQDALYDALANKQIYAAGLDNCVPTTSKLLTLPNIVILPQISSAEYNTRRQMSINTACNILAGIKGVKMLDELE